MRITITLLTLLVVGALSAQTADITTGCAPLSVKFTPPSSATTFFWTFKDGGTSNLASPTNIFTTPGTYSVEFRTTTNGPIVGKVNITVYPKPVVGITAVPESGCIPLSVKFNDTTSLAGDIQVLNYSWVFGDGGSGSGSGPIHIYNTVGAFSVSVELQTNYSTCNVTQVFTDKIHTGVKPLVSFSTTPSPATACVPPLNVSFNNTTVGGAGNLSYSWNFGNGNTSGQPNPPAQTYTQSASYTVTLTATDAFGCSATATAPVVIGNPIAAFLTPDTVCVGDSLIFENTSSFGAYNWTFGPDAKPAASTDLDGGTVFSTPGLKTVTLTVTSGSGCSTTETKQIFADLADATFTVSPSYSCSDPTLFSPNPSSTTGTQWSWTFSDKTTSTAKNPVYKWVTPDTTGYSQYGMYLDTIFLTIGNPSGCTDSYLVVDTIWRPNARFIPNRQHGCAPLEVIFADSSRSNEPIVEWTWLFDDGTAPLIKNNNSPASHTFTQPGEYEVQLVIRNSAGCIDSSYTILIEVGEPITGDFIADKFSVCPGDTVQFTNLTTDPRVDAWHFSSDSDRLWHCFQDQNPIWSYQSETGPMDVSLTTEYNGCLFTVTKPEYIQAKGPIAQLHYKTTCDNTLEFAFTNESHDATSVKWYLGDGDSTLQNNFVHTYAMPGSYTVVLKAENPSSGCPISYDTATVYPTILKAEFDLPDTICGGEKQILDGAKSLGVNAACYKGYTWYFSFQRPIRTDQVQTEFTFGPSGPQTVSLEVEDINGCKDTLTDDIVIYNRYPGFTISDEQICIPSSVTFTDKSTADATIVSYEWDFGDGSMSTDKSPTHIYTTPPPNGLPYFNVVLRIEDDKGCPAYTNGLVFVYKPTSNILTFPQPAQICAGESVSFSATNYTAGGSGLNWQWTFGNGNTATGQGSQQVYPNGGEFPVKMVYTEIATGCKDSTFANVSVQAPPMASFTTDVDTLGILCYPKNIQFKNTSTSPYPMGNPFWDLDLGITTTSNTPSTVFPKGTYTVTLIASTTYGCTSSTTASYTVVGPEGNFSKDKTTICKGDEITFMLTSDTASISSWAWSFGDGTTQEGGDPVKHKYDFLPPSGATTVKLVLRGENDACTIVKEQDIFFSLVAADFQVPPTICAGGDATFLNTSTSADLSAWTFGDGGNSSDVSPSHVYLAEGTYTVSLTVTDQPLGCVDTKTQNITVTGLPNLVVQGDTICPGDTAMLSVLTQFNNATYVWSPANLILQPKDESAVMAIPTQTTDFIVTVIDGSGCTDQATAQVFIPPVFGGAADFDTIVAANSTVILPIIIDPVYTFSWSPLPAPTGNPLSVTVADSSMHYVLTVRDKFGCTDREFKIDILVVPENVLAPNAFTPNNDDANDVFSLITQQGEEELVEVLSLRVFNRWGQKVFEGSGSLTDVGWDGKTDGKEAPSDVYVYVAEVRFATGRIATLKGDVVLLR